MISNYIESNALFIKDLDIPISRITTVERVLQMIVEQSNTLVSPKLWEDPFENFIFNSEIKTYENISVDFGEIAERYYGQCWTYNQIENDYE